VQRLAHTSCNTDCGTRRATSRSERSDERCAGADGRRSHERRRVYTAGVVTQALIERRRSLARIALVACLWAGSAVSSLEAAQAQADPEGPGAAEAGAAAPTDEALPAAAPTPASGPATDPVPGLAADPAPGPAPGQVLRVQLDSIIHPVAAEYVREALAEADRVGARAVVIELNTPGGLLTSTREIFTAMLGARTPVVVFVAPGGAQAASAGFFLLMAADVAAMAPGTNTGAAHPVGGQGEEIEGTLGQKVEQDAAATIRSLAGRHGRNAKLAEEAVRASRSFTAEEALEAGLIEVVAPDIGRLLAAIDGRPVAKLAGESAVASAASGEVAGQGTAEEPMAAEAAPLRVAEATVRDLPMTGAQRFRSLLAHPNVAYLLLSIGGLGIYFELSTPGAILPGVIGAIALVLGFYSLSILPVSAAGIALIVLAIIFFIAEIKVTSYGLLTLAGVVSLVLGSLMLFESADPAIRVSLALVGAVAVTAVVLVAFLASLAVRAQAHRVATGSEGMVGLVGTARTALAPRGKVFVHGEIWDAVAEGEVAAGAAVEVVEMVGLELRVRAAARS
jgi:membrane-bound serine protease (ClpP class)